MQLELRGKKVLVGGGSRGIGLAIARQFVESGAQLAVVARHQQGVDDAVRSLGGDCVGLAADLAVAADCARLTEHLAATWGSLDVLVTCAGSGASVPPGAESAAEWRRVLEVNLFTATNLITAATPLLAQSAPASIVCVASICGLEALGAPVTYSAAKAALLMTVKGLSRPLAAANIRINAVSPGNIMFAGGTWDRKLAENPAAVQAMLAAKVPQHRFGTPEEVAQAVAFLASPQAGFITGANLVVDGGQTCSF